MFPGDLISHVSDFKGLSKKIPKTSLGFHGSFRKSPRPFSRCPETTCLGKSKCVGDGWWKNMLMQKDSVENACGSTNLHDWGDFPTLGK